MTGYEFLYTYCNSTTIQSIISAQHDSDFDFNSNIDDLLISVKYPVLASKISEYQNMSWTEKTLISIIFRLSDIEFEEFSDSDLFCNPSLVKCILKNYLTWDKIIKFLSDGTPN